MNPFFTPNVDAVDHPDGHILVVGDIAVMPAADAKVIPAAAAQVSLRLALFKQQSALIGFIGDDERGIVLHNKLRAAGVSLDVLQVTKWPSYVVPAHLEANAPEQQRVLPFNGMSEYQAHLQNRVERAVRNAVGVVIVDQGFGSLGDARAAIFAAEQARIPSLVLCASDRRRGYEKATRVTTVGALIEADMLDQQLAVIRSAVDDSMSG